MPNSPSRQKKTGESNAFTIPEQGGKSNNFLIPRKKDVIPHKKDGTLIKSNNTTHTGKAISVSSNPFNIKKSGRDYPLSESPNPTFNNQK